MTLVAAIFISSCSSANDCAMASDEGVKRNNSETYKNMWI